MKNLFDRRHDLEAKGLCAASTPQFGEVVYCTVPRRGHLSGDDHTDGTHVWPDLVSESYTPEYLERLLREPMTRVRDWKGDPKRDPSLVADVSSFFVAPPSRKVR